MNKKTAAWLIAFGVLLSAAVFNLDAVAGALWGVVGILKPLLLGLAMAFVVNIPLRLIETLDKKKVIPRGVGVMFSVLLIIAIMVGVGVILLPQLISSGAALVSKLPEWAQQLKAWALRVYDHPEFNEWINSLSVNWDNIAQQTVGYLKSGAFDALSSAANVASDVVGNATSIVIAFIIALGAVSCKERLISQASRTIRAFIKPEPARRIIEAANMTHQAYTGFFTAQLTEALILGALVLVGMLIIGFPRPFMVAPLVSLGALIPLFGAFIAALTAAFFLAAEFSLATGGWFMLFFVVLQQIEGNVIYPRVMGNRIGLPAIWVLTAVVVGGNAMGIIGMILFVPLVSVVYHLVSTEVARREHLRGKA